MRLLPEARSITTRLNLILAGVFLVLLVLASLLSYQRQRSLILAVIRNNSRMISGSVIRELGNTVLPLSVPRGEGGRVHRPEAIQALVNTLSLHGDKYLIRMIPGRETAGAPSISHAEAAALKRFLEGDLRDADRVVAEPGGSRFFVYMRPMVAEKKCLGCHGDPAAAPPAIRAAFPDRRLYGFRENDIMGALSIRIPFSEVTSDIWFNIRKDLYIRFATFLVIMPALAILIRRKVVLPLAEITRNLRSATYDGTSRISLIDAGGEIADLIATVNDLLERLSEKTAMHIESEERYRSIVELSEVPIVTYVSDGKIVIVNSAAESALGIRREDLIGQDFRSLFEDARDVGSFSLSPFSHSRLFRKRVRTRGGRIREMDVGITVLDSEKSLFAARFWEVPGLTEG